MDDANSVGVAVTKDGDIVSISNWFVTKNGSIEILTETDVQELEMHVSTKE